jgi:uncharacterized protein YndB with AHSA1/START domain
MTDSTDHVSVERFIPAPADAIFDLIADPARHQDIDGSGTVRDAKGGGARLTKGSTFGMSMKWGVPYSMTSTVVEYDENRLLAWQTRGPGPIGKLLGGRIWRYELEPAEGGTLVRETWDISQEAPFTKPGVKRLAGTTAKNMAATLARIEEIVTA